ncbi:Ams1p [Sugiyamaella lignohabitans]|uniref:Alpha-mannosidase n=1 Tax=Sugiyamaella lignohabitans TaxID=796027 RepID=A0A167C741_9ASCO|nr:Ams1p [Sugiyamaella lignohabitans]ANB11302.1 Ams1p [Sugiyamaella lignohabitans]
MSDQYARFNNKPVPVKIPKLYDGRIRQFTDRGGDYHDLNLPHFYDRARNDGTDYVKLEVYDVPKLQRPHFKDAIADAKWRKTSKGNSFGPSWSTHWFRINIRIPSDWKYAEQVLFEWNCGNEGLIYTNEGNAVVGLSGQERREWIIPKDWQLDGKWHQFYIETSCNEMSGNNSPPDPNRYFRLDTADIVFPNLEARALNIDFWIIGDASREFPGDSWQKHKARDVLNRIIDVFDRNNPDESIKKGREIAREYIGSEVDSSQVYKTANKAPVYGIGNCHIDTAWLWPFAETHRKVGRSWATQLNLIERYPEYTFTASQVQQFKWLSEDYPDVFARVKEAVKGGRFIPIGGSWVECDTNMPSGEAMLRQFLLGQRFFQHHFGFRTKTYWLPDTFGYSPQIPQFCRLVGIDRFLTQKLSWNSINSFPHSTFNWVALDGSQVVAHMPPDNTYTAQAHFGDVSRSLRQHKNLDVDQHGMLLFGHGDGGGGPTSEMLEKLRRCRGLSDTVDLLPRVQLGKTVDEFYDDILASTDNGNKLVTWVGELYFEFHRGTYTTQAAIKKGNRVSEVIMHDVEFLATLASLKNKDYKYPTKDIDELWENVCLNQFHDVLPGSGIEMIYEDARAIYQHIAEQGEKLAKEALDALNISTHYIPGHSLGALNTLPWGRSQVIEVPTEKIPREVQASSSFISQANGDKLLVQVQAEGSGVALPTTVSSSIPHATAKEIRKGVFVLENGKLRATIENGVLTSVWDQDAQREIIPKGATGNQFVIFEDQCLSFPAWETELYSLDSRKELSAGTVRISQKGPLRAAVEIENVISEQSRIKTTISLDAYQKPTKESEGAFPDISYLEFSCEVEWHETYKFLKVEFPVDVHSDVATYETSYGAHKRPTHFNTTWEVAKFEVPAHKWADLSDYSYGVSLINDCKYGYAIHGNVMRLSLLRAPKSPDAHADMGSHQFRYALLPHRGGVNPDVVRAAYNFNHPLEIVYLPNSNPADIDGYDSMVIDTVPEPKGDEVLRSFTLDGDKSLIMSAVKRFEDDEDVSRGLLPVRGASGRKSVIIRVYESLGGRARAYLNSKQSIARVFKTNALEDDEEALDILSGVDGDKVPIELRAFEIATFRIELA